MISFKKAQEPRGSSRNATLFVFLILMGVSFGILAFSTRSFALNVKELGFTAISGVSKGVAGTLSFFSESVSSIKALASLRKDYALLLERLDDYEILQRDSAGIRAENQRLREQLGFADTIVYRHLSARVIGREPDNLFSEFIIDKGSKHGVARNMPVIAYQDGVQGLVGKIVQVGRTTSLIMPVYDVRANVAVRFESTRYEGICAGQGDPEKNLVMRYVKKRAKDELSFGDIVVSSGMGRVYPPEIAIGRVSKILSRDYETSMEVELSPVIDFSRLEYVFALDVSDAEALDD